MALVSQSIKNYRGGVSQQPDILRYPNQGSEQINGWSSETSGLQKRPPTEFIKRLNNVPRSGKPLVHMINRDKDEQYFVTFPGAGLTVHDLKGNQYTVRGYNGYATTANPRDDLRVITVADYTFVTNRNKVVELASGLTNPSYPPLASRCLINVRGGQYGRTLSFTINGTLAATLKMPNGSAEKVPAGDPYAGMNQVDMTDANFIARELALQVPVKMPGWTAVAGAGYILVTAPTGTSIASCVTSDGYGDQLINGFIYQVQTFSKLPVQAPPGYVVEVTGESARSGDNYWLMYSAEGKVWKETAKPGITAGIYGGSMPHALVRASDGQFDWMPLSWVLRNAGDDETNPMPSFVGGKINDVFFFRNRLGFLSGENIILSKPGKFFDFFPSSVAVLSDDDPIDVSISHNRVSILKYAVPFAEQLLLWSDQAQFVMSANGVLSAKTIELNLTTEFDVSDGARPYGIGRGVYFAAPRADFTSLKRYYAVQDVSDVKSAEDVSAHVPRYIPNTVHAIHGSGTENFVSILTDGAPGYVYIYKFLYMEEELVQQSFSFWEFGADCTVYAASCIGSYMYLMIDRPQGVQLERINFTQDTKDFPIEPWRTYLDMKTVATLGQYDEDTDLTPLLVEPIYGYRPSPDTILAVVDQEGVMTTHREDVWTPSSTIYFRGNRTGEQVIVGRKYEFRYVMSKLLIKNQADDGTVATEDSGRLQLRRAWLNYEDSGAFTVIVDNGSREFRYVMTGGRTSVDRVIGKDSIGTGQFRFPVTGGADRQKVTITSDEPNPVNIIGGGWEGNYIRRSSGI